MASKSKNEYFIEEEYKFLHYSLTSSFQQLHKKLDERESYLSDLLIETYRENSESEKDRSNQLLQMKNDCDTFIKSTSKNNVIAAAATSQVLKPILDQIEELEKERKIVKMEFNTDEVDVAISKIGNFIITKEESKESNSDLIISDKIPNTVLQSKILEDNRTKVSLIPGLCGLKNIDNSSLNNSILQCLIHTTPLVSYFTNDSGGLKPYSDDTAIGRQLIQSLGEIFKVFWSGKSFVNTTDYGHIIDKIFPSCEDAYSLLEVLLQHVHRELNTANRKLKLDFKESCATDEKISQVAWNLHSLNNQSIISQNFHGQLKISLTCRECKSTATSFEPFSTLSLPLTRYDLNTDKKDMRNIKLTFVKLNPKVKPIFYNVPVLKNSLIRDLCREISDISGVDSDKMFVCDVYSHRFHKIFDQNEKVSSISERDDIIVYEAPIDSLDDPNFMCLPVYNRETRHTQYTSITSHSYVHNYLFGLPLIIPIPRNSTSYADLYRICLYHMQRYINKQTDCSDDIADPNLFDISQYPPHMFKLKLVNAYGSAEMGELRNDGQPLKLMNISAIALHWDSKYRDRYNVALVSEVDKSNTLERHLNFKKCFKIYLGQDTLPESGSIHCSNCEEKRHHARRREIWKLPDYLILHFQRFEFERKLNMLVDFPFNLDLTTFLQKATDNPVYELYAVCNHYGSIEGGHYATSVKMSDGEFYNFDNISISRFLSCEAVITNAAYILFYKRICI